MKWYDDYDDVQAFRQLFTIVEQFGKEREGFKYAYREIAVGEDGATNEDEGENCKKLGFVCDERMEIEPAQIKFDNGDSLQRNKGGYRWLNGVVYILRIVTRYSRRLRRSWQRLKGS